MRSISSVLIDTKELLEWLTPARGRNRSGARPTGSMHIYGINPVLEALTADAPAVSGIVEELFPMAAMTDHHADSAVTV